jgi:hypothetical protein
MKTGQRKKDQGKRQYPLFPKADIAKTSPITRKLAALLTVEGFSLVNSERMEHSGFKHDVNVNRLEYLRSERERVYLYTHEPIGDGV